MAYKLIITDSAEKDLDGILTYIITELDNLDAAMKLADDIDEKYGKLEDNPQIYEECRDPRLKLMGYPAKESCGFQCIELSFSLSIHPYVPPCARLFPLFRPFPFGLSAFSGWAVDTK